MRAAMARRDLSARAYHRILKLAGSEEIQTAHLAALTVCFAKALHASQSSIVNAGIKSLDEDARTMKRSRDNATPLCYSINIYSGHIPVSSGQTSR